MSSGTRLKRTQRNSSGIGKYSSDEYSQKHYDLHVRNYGSLAANAALDGPMK
jgi:hypothetical protein